MQELQLHAAISMFPSLAKQELGRISLVSDHIDLGDAKSIKQRHYSISPGLEKLSAKLSEGRSAVGNGSNGEFAKRFGFLGGGFR